MIKKSITLFLLLLMGSMIYAQTDGEKTQPTRTGWTFGALPSISYDSDLGFQYGALANIYYFGDGSTYPEYLHSIYLEASNTTMNSGLLRFYYDSKHLIPDHRVSLDLSYMPDPMSPFYGFNGYQTIYNPNLIDNNSTDYVSRAFYAMKRNLFRLAADMQGPIAGSLSWNAGFGILDYNIDRFDFDRFNSRKSDPAKQLNDTTTLFDIYRTHGVITDAELNGGFHPYVHGGFTFDTRDRQQNPHSGIYADAFVTYSAAFGDQQDYNNIKLNATFRQYVPLDSHRRFTFAYRLGTQLLLAGQSTFYSNNFINQLYWQRCIYEGLGGASSLRGILRNRINADGFAFANAELRMQFFNFKIGKENFYLGLNPFMDAGVVLQQHPVNGFDDAEVVDSDPQAIHRLHLSAGCGLKIAMNDNFVVSVDWGTPLDNADNHKVSNMYIKIGYMF